MARHHTCISTQFLTLFNPFTLVLAQLYLEFYCGVKCSERKQKHYNTKTREETK